MKNLGFLFILVVLSSCGPGKPNEQAFLDNMDTVNSGPVIDDALISEIIQRIPSPLEISIILKESGKNYNSAYLNPSENVHRYNTNYQKALNIGIYGTDLGYTNIYEKNQDGIKYIAAIKSLADDLNIGQFFDIETMSRLATNSKNLDSLLLITTQNFNTINEYFQQQSRSNLSVLLLVGGWLEAMNITCRVAAQDPHNKLLQEKIGEQKLVLESVIELLDKYKDSNSNMASLLAEIRKLEEAYAGVEINYEYREPEYEIVNGVMVVKDNSTTTITITEEDIATIRTVTDQVRSKIIS